MQLNDALIESWTVFNYFIRSREKLRRDRNAKFLSGLEVDDQLELRGPLHREIAWLGPFKNLIHVDCGPASLRDAVRCVAHEPTETHKP